MNAFIDWLPWVAIALLPGGCNAIVAYQELIYQCRFIPFFTPHKSLGVWLWGIIQVLIPAIAFWLIFKLVAKPSINLQLFGKAILFGVAFSILCNTEITLNGQKYAIKSGYSFLVQIAFNLIRSSSQAKRATFFWDELEASLKKELENNRLYLPSGLRALENYFMLENTLSVETRGIRDKRLEKIRERIDKINQEADLRQKAKGIKRLLQEAEHKELIPLLQAFHCEEALLKKYFPK